MTDSLLLNVYECMVNAAILLRHRTNLLKKDERHPEKCFREKRVYHIWVKHTIPLYTLFITTYHKSLCQFQISFFYFNLP